MKISSSLIMSQHIYHSVSLKILKRQRAPINIILLTVIHSCCLFYDIWYLHSFCGLKCKERSVPSKHLEYGDTLLRGCRFEHAELNITHLLAKKPFLMIDRFRITRKSWRNISSVLIVKCGSRTNDCHQDRSSLKG